MEIFQKGAEKALGEQIFCNTPLQYELLEIANDDLTTKRLSRQSLSVADLRRGATQWAGADSMGPSLKLVKLDFEPATRQKLYSTADDIFELFRCLELDTYILYMMCRDVMGFHQVSVRQSILSLNESVFNFFINNEPLKVLWSFNTTNLATKGIILTRVTPGGRACYSDFYQLLDQYSHLIVHPLLLAFIVVLETVAFSDKIVNKQEEVVSQTELRTGFSPWSLDVCYDFSRPAELENFSFFSQKMGASLVELEDVLRHTKIMQRIITSLQEHGSHYRLTLSSEPKKICINNAHEDISKILSLIQPQLEYTELYIGYLRERAKNQLSVVS
jgi:hypothetical protein